MSLISTGATPVIPGTVELFARPDTPPGYARLHNMRVDRAVYSTLSSRLLPVDFIPGDSSVTSPAGVAWARDVTSDEHIYMLSTSSMRHHNVLTGSGTVRPMFVTAGGGVPSLAVSDEGVYALQGVALWFYTPEEDAWTRLGTVNSTGGTAALFLDSAGAQLLSLRVGSTSSSNIYDIATRQVSALPGLGSREFRQSGVVIGRSLLCVSRATSATSYRLCTMNLDTLEVIEHSPANLPAAPLGLVRVNDNLVFASCSSTSSSASPAALISLDDAGAPVVTPLSIAGLDGRVALLGGDGLDMGLVAGNNLFVRFGLAVATPTHYAAALLSLADLDAELPRSSIFYARKL